MVGILVHGNNHFILSGPSPDEATALALVRYWSIIQIGEAKSSSFAQWEIKSKEFRENLEWAVIVPGESEVSPGVALLLAELSARGVSIRRLPTSALDTKGFIKTGAAVHDVCPLRRAPYLLETSLPGVFAVGDIRAESVKRVASAVGEGSMVVQFVHKVLAE
jgi:hypothetical protein